MRMVLGVVLIIIGLSSCIVSRIQLGKSWTIKPYAYRLVTHGFYHKFRHPMYTFAGVWIGGVLMLVSWKLLILLLPYIIIQHRRAKRESQVLSAEFQRTYWSWHSQTWF